MNVIVTIRNGQRERREVADPYDFAKEVEAIGRHGVMLFYGKNDIGGASAIFEV